MKVEKKEVLRYMRILPEQCTPDLDAMIQEEITRLQTIIRPKHVFKQYDCTVTGSHLTVGSMEIESHSLSKLLAPCTQAVLMAATLGHETDQLLRQLSLTDVGRAVVLQAVSVAMIEAYCDEVEREIISTAKEQGYQTKERFSPGYGDFSIEHQSDFFRMLDCQKCTGMTLTDTMMMNPIKSVTAIIGLY